MRLSRLTLGLLLIVAGRPLAAQEEPYPWRVSDFPYLMGDPTNGLLIIGHFQYAREADYDARVPFDGYLGLEAAWGTRSSRFLVAKFRAPGLLKGWRFGADAGGVREGKFGYFGQGPEGEGDFGSASDLANDFFRVHRTRYFVRGEVTRKLYGPLAAAVAAGVVNYRYTPTKDGDAFRTDFFDDPLKGTDATARLALVLDTRDREVIPTKGFLVEAGVYAGSGRFEERNLAPGGGGSVSAFTDKGYTGVYAHARGFFSPLRTTVIAGRLAIRSLTGNAPLDARYVIPGWEREITVLGGADSHRSFIKGRFVGRGVFFGSLEVRHTLIDVGDYGALAAVAFLDGGRAFQENARLSFKDWKVGGGGGLAFKVIRSALISINFAGGPDGFTFSMGNAWAF